MCHNQEISKEELDLISQELNHFEDLEEIQNVKKNIFLLKNFFECGTKLEILEEKTKEILKTIQELKDVLKEGEQNAT